MTSRVGRPPSSDQNQNRAFPLPVGTFSVYFIYDIMHMWLLKIRFTSIAVLSKLYITSEHSWKVERHYRMIILPTTCRSIDQSIIATLSNLIMMKRDARLTDSKQSLQNRNKYCVRTQYIYIYCLEGNCAPGRPQVQSKWSRSKRVDVNEFLISGRYTLQL